MTLLSTKQVQEKVDDTIYIIIIVIFSINCNVHLKNFFFLTKTSPLHTSSAW